LNQPIKKKYKMKYLFHLGHPAHFHLFKNVIANLKANGNQIFILIKKKDVLEDLLIESGLEFQNILPEGRKDSFLSIGIGLMKQDLSIFKFCRKHKPDLLIGSSTSITHVGKVLGIPSIVLGEDDTAIVPIFAKLSYPFATTIITPDVCNKGKWDDRSIKYKGYHELAYLHPNHFVPDKTIVENYIDVSRPYFLIRFAKLDAHHDSGISGINDNLALEIIKILQPFGNVYITSEREFHNELESFRLNVKPVDIHHVMAYSTLYIGDSQTMAAEAGVLGIPFIRFNDFVGKIGYLNDLENKYKLGYGIKSDDEELLFKTINKLLEKKEIKKEWQIKKEFMLSKKIDVAIFITRFIENYPESFEIKRKNLSLKKGFISF